MADEHCSGCGAEVGTGVCVCPEGTMSVQEQRDRLREALTMIANGHGCPMALAEDTLKQINR